MLNIITITYLVKDRKFRIIYTPRNLFPDLFPSFKSYFLSLFILEERESTSRGGAERERITSRLCTDSAEFDVGLELMNCEIMT